MNRREFCMAGAAGVCGVLALTGGAREAVARPTRWVELYNGKDLTGWHVMNGKAGVWKAEGELVVCQGDGGGWLTSDRQYGDFELEVEWKIPPGGNSGIGLRYPGQGDPAHEGMEIQVLDDPHPMYKNLHEAQYTGGIYYQAAATAHPEKKAGEWNKYFIRCKGPRVYIKLNDVVVQDVSLDDFTHGWGGHKALAVRPRSGYVGLQSHTDRVEFRNIRIREL